MRRKIYDDDDGRVISNMNVEGMPWYSPHQATLSSSSSDDPNYAPSELSRKETFWVIMGAMKAGLIVAGVFSLAFLLAVGIFLLL